jgi:valyl-tRNA synthetase
MKRELPKAYEPSQYEDGIYKKWEKSGYFNPDNLALAKEAGSYSIVMPPPNRTGILHMGHAAMLALEDILIRYHRMKGDQTLWVPGTDHAAIATQTKVEKILREEGTDRHKLGREKFLERVRQFAQDSHGTIVNQVKRMGCSCDWGREAYTLDEVRTRTVQAVFKTMYDDGLIYRGERIVNWCPRCQSTLADDEVEYKTQKAKFYSFRYSQDFPFMIATTRPETKLGDTAVAVNPKDKRYQKYIGKIYQVDFVGVPLKLKIIADRSVDMEFGTGALGVTPAHSIIDWQMAEENKLEIIKVINEEGNIHQGLGDYSGKTVLEAREMVVQKLRKQGLLKKEEDIENNLSLCYRCDTPIEPLPSLQWFINVNKKIPRYNKSIKELSIEAVKEGVFGKEKIKIVPQRFTKSYFHWMENLRDWCISRQIWFGHRVPVWYKSTINNSQLTINNEKEIYVGIEPPKGEGWQQDEDTLDTWFSSGLWTFSTLANKPEQITIKDGQLVINSEDFKKFHPTSVLETGYDILFFWVARMIIMITYAVGDIPFQDVYLHGLIRDAKGRKMSKSRGNVIDPLDMVKKYGADATRLSLVVGTTPGNDMNLSEAKIAGFRNFTNKLWNISRYIIGNLKLPACADREISNLEDVEIKKANKDLTVADLWILEKMRNLISQTSDDINNYQFSQAGEKLREFTWGDLADWYIEASKFEKNTEKDKILIIILKDLLKLWHPFMPFVTEAIWQEMGNKNLLLVERWPKAAGYKRIASLSKASLVSFELIINFISKIRNARSVYRIKPSQKIKAVIYGGQNTELIKSQAELIKRLRTGISELEIKKSGEKIKEAIYLTVNGIEIYLLIPGFDFKAEIARIKQEIKEQKIRIKALEKKLANKQFVAKAPEQIVYQEKEKLVLWRDELKKLQEQLNNIN